MRAWPTADRYRSDLRSSPWGAARWDAADRLIENRARQMINQANYNNESRLERGVE